MENGIIAKLEGVGTVFNYTPLVDVVLSAVGSPDCVLTIQDAVLFNGTANKSYSVVIAANQSVLLKLTEGAVGLIFVKKV